MNPDNINAEALTIVKRTPHKTGSPMRKAAVYRVLILHQECYSIACFLIFYFIGFTTQRLVQPLAPTCT